MSKCVGDLTLATTGQNITVITMVEILSNASPSVK